MKYPIRAMYGEKNNMHTLLKTNFNIGELPYELMGLTDKPSGSSMPNTIWSPSVGCSPIGEWWALWWSVPDKFASRAGMVKSEVAIWPLDKISDVEDLHPILLMLAGDVDIIIPNPEVIAAVGKSLVENNNPVVFTDLNEWPGLIISIWKRLWPSARKAFSARVAFSPPQSGESVIPPLMYCVPPENINHWSSYKVVNCQDICIKNDRVAAWFITKEKTVFNEILIEDTLEGLSLKDLKKLIRAADRLEILRKEQTTQSAVAFIRTLDSIYPSIESVKKKGNYALSIINSKLIGSNLEAILSFANLELKLFFPEVNIKSKIENWITQHIFKLPIKDFSNLLEYLSPSNAIDWWQESVFKSLNNCIIDFTSVENDRVLLLWLTIKGYNEVLLKIIPPMKEIEERLISIVNDANFTNIALENIRDATIIRQWSILHAWATSQLYSSHEAFILQYSFNGDFLSGIKFLINNLPGSVVITEAITRDSSDFYSLVAVRTVKEPILLQDLDVRDIRWLKLWAIHLLNNGDKWPNPKEKNKNGLILLDTVLLIEIPENIISHIASDLAEIAFNYKYRAKLWKSLHGSDRKELISYVAEYYLKSLSKKKLLQEKPEQPLLEIILAKLCSKDELSPLELLIILNWADNEANEDKVVGWLKSLNWNMYGKEIGQAISKLKFRKAANTIRDLYRHRSKCIDFELAFFECKHLCSFNIFSSSLFNIFINPLDRQKKQNEIVNICADLVPTGDGLIRIWQRAGGAINLLSQKGNTKDQWIEAIDLAEKGSLPQGALSIICILLEDFPHNHKLRDIKDQNNDEFFD